MTETEIFLQQAIAELLECEPPQVSLTRQFGELGLDSLMGLRLARRIQDRVGSEVELELLFDHPSIELLAAFLAQQPAMAAAGRLTETAQQ